jgi:hypothetical protein
MNIRPKAFLGGAALLALCAGISPLAGCASAGKGAATRPPAGAPPGGGSQTVDHGAYAKKVASDLSGGTFSSTGEKENALRVEGAVTVKLADITIDKSAGAAGSGGVMVAGGGALHVSKLDIETEGGSSAALRTDRGGGTLVAEGGSFVTHGVGSPAIYSTADVKASGATLTATGSEAVVVEGKNLHNVMIYQSMSGDAASGKSSFSMKGGSLTSLNGDMFYVTDTSCAVKLTGVALKLSSDRLLKVVVDKISSLSLSLAKGSRFSGSIDTANEGGSVSLSLDATSNWTLTADSYLSSLSGPTDNIAANGHKLYVEGKLVKR